MWFGQRNYCAFSILLLLILSCCSQLSKCVIVPQELPTILSLVYSNIPPIKKGTDSRLGFGFRLGQHADFQVVIELGPQKETRPLGNKQSSDNAFKKRQVDKAEQQLRQQQWEQMTSTERSANTWLENWSKDMTAGKKITKSKQRLATKQHNGKDLVVPTAPLVPEQALNQLQLLYKMATTTESTSTTTSTTTPAPFRGGSLNLGGPAGFRLSTQAVDKEVPQLLSNIQPRGKASQKTKDEITKELMDVSLEAEE